MPTVGGGQKGVGGGGGGGGGLFWEVTKICRQDSEMRNLELKNWRQTKKSLRKAALGSLLLT